MSDDFSVQISYKLGPNNQDMLNVRAATVAELDSLLSYLSESSADDISTIQAIVSTGELLRAAGIAAPLLVPQQAQPPHPAVPQSYQQTAPQQSPTGKACQHGTYVWAEGISKKTGKPYRMWKCPQPGTDCRPDFA